MAVPPTATPPSRVRRIVAAVAATLAIGLTVAGGRAEAGREAHVDEVDRGAGEVADRERVLATAGEGVDLLELLAGP